MTSILYRKLLQLPLSGVARATPGKLITLASGDMALIEQGAWGLPYVVSAPLSSIFEFAILFHIVSHCDCVRSVVQPPPTVSSSSSPSSAFSFPSVWLC